MSFTAEELQKEINEAYNGSDFFLNAFYEEEAELNTRLGKVVLEDISGGQGDGAPIEMIISVADRYFEINGVYNSWDDSHFDGDLYEVNPKQVTVTRYERIKND